MVFSSFFLFLDACYYCMDSKESQSREEKKKEKKRKKLSRHVLGKKEKKKSSSSFFFPPCSKQFTYDKTEYDVGFVPSRLLSFFFVCFLFVIVACRDDAGHLNVVLRSSTPGLKRDAKSQPTSLLCNVGLLVASANRSRVESYSGGPELVPCPHCRIYRAYTRPRVVPTLIKEL